MKHYFEQDEYIEEDLEGFLEAEGEIEAEEAVTVSAEFRRED